MVERLDDAAFKKKREGFDAIKGHEHGTIGVASWVNDALSKQNRRGNGYQNKTECKNGHKYEKGSYKMVKTHGVFFARECIQCKRDTRKKSRENRTPEQRAKIAEYDKARYAAKKLGISVKEYRDTYEAAIKKNPLDALKLNPEQAKAQEQVNFFIDNKREAGEKVTLKCQDDPDAYFFEPGTKVSDKKAQALCAGCPLVGTGLCLDDVKKTASPHQISIAEGRVLIGIEVRGE